MNNLSNTLPFRYIDDLNRNATELYNSTNHLSWKHIGQRFTEMTKNREALRSEMRLNFIQNGCVSSNTSDSSKIIEEGATFLDRRLSGRKRVSIQKKRSSAYPLTAKALLSYLMAEWCSGFGITEHWLAMQRLCIPRQMSTLEKLRITAGTELENSHLKMVKSI
jgi:hypothetical protein